MPMTTQKREVSKLADGSIRIDTKINKKGAEQGLDELKRIADTKVKQLEKGVASAGNEVGKLNEKFNQTSQELSNVEQQMDLVADRVLNTYRDFEGIGEEDFNKFIQGQIEADSEYQKLQSKQKELNAKVEEYKIKLDSSTKKHKELNASLGQAKKEQTEVNKKVEEEKNKQAEANKKLEEAKKKAEEFKGKMNEATKSTKKTSVESLGISKSLGSAVKKLATFGVALLGFQGIYSTLQSSMNEWLNGSSRAAKQLQADISNLKVNIGAALAPAIQSVLQIFYKILAVVGAIVKAFTNINIFSKNTSKTTAKTAKNTASTAKSAKQASNNLASWDSLNVLSKDNDSGGSGGGNSDVTPTDLSSLIPQYKELAEKIKNIFEFILEPFEKAWETTGQSVIDAMYNALNGIKSLISAIGDSFTNIWTNGTVQTTAELLFQILANILNTIGNMSNAFADAWREGGKGNEIIQYLADAINNVLGIAESITKVFAEWWKSEKGQQFADAVVSIFETISKNIEKLTENFKKIWDNGASHAFKSILDACSNIIAIFDEVLKALSPLAEAIGNFASDALADLFNGIGWVVDKFNEFTDWILGNSDECDTLAIVIGSIATAITLVVTAMKLFDVIGVITTGVTTALGVAINILTSPITLVILAIAAIVAGFILLYKHSEKFRNFINGIVEAAGNLLNGIIEGISNGWGRFKEWISGIFNSIIDWFKDIFQIHSPSAVFSELGGYIVQGLINGIKSLVGKITRIMEYYKNPDCEYCKKYL